MRHVRNERVFMFCREHLRNHRVSGGSDTRLLFIIIFERVYCLYEEYIIDSLSAFRLEPEALSVSVQRLC
jgi:hypothetical protein